MKTLTLILGGLLFCAANLSAEFSTEEAKRHIIVVDHVGRPFLPTITKIGRDNFAVHLELFDTTSDTASSDTYRQYVKDIVNNLGKRQKILFFIHGGMNNKIGAVQRAAKLIDNGDIKRGDYYPVFICWDSPPFQTYWENARWVRAGKTEKYFRGKLYAFLTTPFYLLGDLGRAATRLPVELSALGYNDVYSIYPNKFTEYERMQKEYCYLRHPDDPKQRIEVSKGSNKRSPAGEIGRNISLFLTAPLKIATEPVIDAIGVEAWDNMIRRTDTMFDAIPMSRKTPMQTLLSEEPTGALSIFMKALRDAPGSENYQVTIVGHSMGTIIANRMIQQYPTLHYKNIVYMAAACRVSDFETSVLPYLELERNRTPKEPAKFYNLCLHPKCESGEIYYMGKMPLDVPPRGSLLVWIDNIFGHPPSETRRMFGVFQTALIQSHNIPNNLRPMISYKAFPAGVTKAEAESDQRAGVNWHPQRHGDFADGPFWKEEFWRPADDDMLCVSMVEKEKKTATRLQRTASPAVSKSQ